MEINKLGALSVIFLSCICFIQAYSYSIASFDGSFECSNDGRAYLTSLGSQVCCYDYNSPYHGLNSEGSCTDYCHRNAYSLYWYQKGVDACSCINYCVPRGVTPIIPSSVCDLVPPSNNKARVIGGNLVSDIKDFSYQVALQQDGSGFFCGGSLVASNWVLTSGHCFRGFSPVYNTNPAQVSIIAGSIHLQQPVEVINVEQVFFHPNWTSNVPTQNRVDLALIKLSSSSQSGVPISIPGSDFDGLELFVQCGVASGWGVYVVGTNLNSDQLKAISMETTSCPDGEDSEFCAGETNQTLCSGDSGGPFVITTSAESNSIKLQIGVITSVEVGDNDVPCVGVSYITAIAPFMDWISSTTNGSVVGYTPSSSFVSTSTTDVSSASSFFVCLYAFALILICSMV